MQNNIDVLNSYKKSFNSFIGAYSYMTLNQHFPDFFVLSSSNEAENIEDNLLFEKICRESQSLEEIISKITEINDKYFQKIEEETIGENDLSKSSIIRHINNISYSGIDMNLEWDNLQGLIEFNNFSPFISNKGELLNILKETKKEYSLDSINLNYNYDPFNFLKKFKENSKILCETLDIRPDQIGLGELELNYKTEYGDFSGYTSRAKIDKDFNSRIVINNLDVFAHEWLHFIESSLGHQGYSVSQLLEIENFSLFFKDISSVSELNSIFKTSINNESNDELVFSNNISDYSRFFNNYALDKENLSLNMQIIAKKYYKDAIESEDKESAYNNMESEIKKLLKEPFPTRYFSFIKAQFYLTSMEIEHNNFYDFAHKADSFLGEEDYTSSNIEVLARTFETFIFTKTDGKFDFISKNYNSDFYPQNEMRDKFNVFWEKTWKEFRSRLNNDFSKINTPLTVISNIQQFRRDNEEANNLKKKKLKSS